MTRIIEEERIGSTVDLKVGCAAAIFDESREKLLMTRRMDNDQWCLPGGGMEPGESAAECCVREVMEETGLQVTASRLIGIYTTPHRIMVYSERHKYQFVSMLFEAIVTGGQPGLSDETSEIGYFTRDEIARLDLMVSHLERIPDVFAESQTTYVR